MRWFPEGDDAEYEVPTMTFRASAGERNRLVVRGGDRMIEIRDAHPIRLVVRERRRARDFPRAAGTPPDGSAVPRRRTRPTATCIWATRMTASSPPAPRPSPCPAAPATT